MKLWHKIFMAAFYMSIGSLLLSFVKTIPDIYNGWDIAWYRKEVRFSDWRNVGEVDFATNAVPSYFYTGICPKYLRQENIREFIDRINKGDTLRLGIDYYANFPISRGFVEAIAPELYSDTQYRSSILYWWRDKGVYRLKVWRENNFIRWEAY
jgi:hypothetical protein